MPMSPESSYIVQSMEELCEITADLSWGAFHMELDVDGMVDVNANIAEELESSYRDWRSTVDTDEQLHVSMYGVLGSEGQYNEQITHIANKIIQAYRATNGKSDPMGGYTDEVSLYIPTEDDMTKESHVRHFLERDREQKWMRLLEQQYIDFVEDFHGTSMSSFKEWERERINQMAVRMDEIVRQTLAPHIANKNQHVNRKNTKRGQKVLKKGVQTFTNLFGKEDINAFISGDGFTIAGDLYDYRVSKTCSLVEYSAHATNYHVPYRLQLLTKEGILLADGCIYFKDTPVVDQLIAMMLHIKNGNELEILKNTNFSRTSDAYVNEKLLADIKEERKRKMLERTGGGDALNIRDIPIFQEMEKQSTDLDIYRPVIRPIVENVLLDMLDIPETAVRFMLKPPFVYDNIQFMAPAELESVFHGQALLAAS